MVPSVHFEIGIPESVAMLEDGFAPEHQISGPPQVILFQDAHTNASGQFNLALALERVLRVYPVDRVYVEGGWGDCSLTDLKRTADPASLKSAAERFVRAGKLQGEEYLSLTSDLDFAILGAEEPDLYGKGLEAYAASVQARGDALRYLDRIRRGLQDQERFVFDPALNRFESERERFHAGQATFSEWTRSLLTAAKKYGVYLGGYRELRALRRLSALERSVDAERLVNEQREAAGLLTEEVRNEFERLTGTAAPAAADGSEAARGAYLYLADQLGSRIRSYPHLKRYVRYLSESLRLSASGALKELAALENDVLGKLARTPEQKLLIEFKTTADLLQKLVRLQITPEEYADLLRKGGRSGAEYLSGFVNARIMDRESGYEGAIVLKEDLFAAEAAAKRFYALAADRDRLFLAAIDKGLSEKGRGPVVLITGGFHTAALKKLLRARGISFVSILPQVREETDQARYERLLLQQRTSGENVLDASQKAAGPSLRASQRLTPIQLRPEAFAALESEAGIGNGARMADESAWSRMRVTEEERTATLNDPNATVDLLARVTPDQIQNLPKELKGLGVQAHPNGADWIDGYFRTGDIVALNAGMLNLVATDAPLSWRQIKKRQDLTVARKVVLAKVHTVHNGPKGFEFMMVEPLGGGVFDQGKIVRIHRSYPLVWKVAGARMANGSHLKTLDTIITELHRLKEMESWLPAVTVFGSARIPGENSFFRAAYDLGRQFGIEGIAGRTGAGPSIMEAVPMGTQATAPDRTELRQGIRIELPFEQETNPFIDLILRFDHFLTRKRALEEKVIATVAMPGGIGTMDEFFEAMRRNRPTVLFGERFWWPVWNAFYDAWTRSGIHRPFMDGSRVRPFITNNIVSVMDFIRNQQKFAEHHGHFATPHARIDELIGELTDAYLALHRMPSAVTLVGQPSSDSRLLDEAVRLSVLAWGEGVQVRVASEGGLERRIWDRARTDRREDFFQTVIFKPRTANPIRFHADVPIPEDRQIVVRDESLHQFLTAAHSSAFVFLPGGFGTMNRLFDIVQLMQVRKVERQPIVLLGRDHWQPILDSLRKIWLETEGVPAVVSPEDLDLFRVADTAEEALEALMLRGNEGSAGARMADGDRPSLESRLIRSSHRTLDFLEKPTVMNAVRGLMLVTFGTLPLWPLALSIDAKSDDGHPASVLPALLPPDTAAMIDLTRRCLEPGSSLFGSAEADRSQTADRLRTAVRATIELLPEIDRPQEPNWHIWLQRPGNATWFRSSVEYLLVQMLLEDRVRAEGTDEATAAKPDLGYPAGALEVLLDNVGRPDPDRWWAALAGEVEEVLKDEVRMPSALKIAGMARQVLLADRIAALEQPDLDRILAAIPRPEGLKPDLKLPPSVTTKLVSDPILAAKLHLLNHTILGSDANRLLSRDPGLAAVLSRHSFLALLHLQLHADAAQAFDPTVFLKDPASLSAGPTVASGRFMASQARALVTRAGARQDLSEPLVLTQAPQQQAEVVLERAAQALLRTGTTLELLGDAAGIWGRRGAMTPDDRETLEQLVRRASEGLDADRGSFDAGLRSLQDYPGFKDTWDPHHDDASNLIRAFEGADAERVRLLRIFDLKRGARMAGPDEDRAAKGPDTLRSLIVRLDGRIQHARKSARSDYQLYRERRDAGAYATAPDLSGHALKYRQVAAADSRKSKYGWIGAVAAFAVGFAASVPFWETTEALWIALLPALAGLGLGRWSWGMIEYRSFLSNPEYFDEVRTLRTALVRLSRASSEKTRVRYRSKARARLTAIQSSAPYDDRPVLDAIDDYLNGARMSLQEQAVRILAMDPSQAKEWETISSAYDEMMRDWSSAEADHGPHGPALRRAVERSENVFDMVRSRESVLNPAWRAWGHAAIFLANLEFALSEGDQEIPAPGQFPSLPPTGTESEEAIRAAYQEWFWGSWVKAGYFLTPAPTEVGLLQPVRSEPPVVDAGQILTLRGHGFDPDLTDQDLYQWIYKRGASAVESLQVVPHAGPGTSAALRITLKDPIVDAWKNLNARRIEAVLLRVPNGTLADAITDPEPYEAFATGPGADPIDHLVRVEKFLQALRQGRFVWTGGYQIYRESGAQAAGEFFGRNENERTAIQAILRYFVTASAKHPRAKRASPAAPSDAHRRESSVTSDLWMDPELHLDLLSDLMTAIGPKGHLISDRIEERVHKNLARQASAVRGLAAAFWSAEGVHPEDPVARTAWTLFLLRSLLEPNRRKDLPVDLILGRWRRKILRVDAASAPPADPAAGSEAAADPSRQDALDELWGILYGTVSLAVVAPGTPIELKSDSFTLEDILAELTRIDVERIRPAMPDPYAVDPADLEAVRKGADAAEAVRGLSDAINGMTEEARSARIRSETDAVRRVYAKLGEIADQAARGRLHAASTAAEVLFADATARNLLGEYFEGYVKQLQLGLKRQQGPSKGPAGARLSYADADQRDLVVGLNPAEMTGVLQDQLNELAGSNDYVQASVGSVSFGAATSYGYLDRNKIHRAIGIAVRTAQEFLADDPAGLELLRKREWVFFTPGSASVRGPPTDLIWRENDRQYAMSYTRRHEVVELPLPPITYLSLEPILILVDELESPLLTSERKHTISRWITGLLLARDRNPEDFIRTVQRFLQSYRNRKIAEEAVLRDRSRNFEDEGIPGDRAIFVMLPIKDGADKIETWFQRMLEDLEPAEGYHIEFVIASNGSDDDTAEEVRDIMRRHKVDQMFQGKSLRITLIDLPEAGKNAAINAMYREVSRRFDVAGRANPDLKVYLHFSDDDAYPVRIKTNGEAAPRSQVLDNIALLEHDDEARARVGETLKIVATTPVAPVIRLRYTPLGIWRYWFQRVTNVRKGPYGVPLTQIYGQSYTMNLLDFPSAGVPEELYYEDCFLCALHWPHISTNPMAHHEHAEPADWRTFMRRYVRDVRHRTQLGEYFNLLGAGMGERFGSFVRSMEESHQKLTDEIRRRHPRFTVTRALHWINGMLKRFLVFRMSHGKFPELINDARGMVRGTNVGNVELIRPNDHRFAVVTRNNIVASEHEYLWEVVVAAGLDRDGNNRIQMKEVLDGIPRLAGTARILSGEEAQLRAALAEIWSRAGLSTDQSMTVLEFAVALHQTVFPEGRVRNYFLQKTIFALYHASHNTDDWILAYTALAKLVQTLRESENPNVLSVLLEVARKSGIPMSPLLIPEVFKAAQKNGMLVRIGSKRYLVQGRLSGGAWKVRDESSSEICVFQMSKESEYQKLAQMHRAAPRSFIEPLTYDPVLRVRINKGVQGESFYQYLDSDVRIGEALDISIQVGEAAAAMQDLGMVHGDLRRPHAVLVGERGKDARPVLLNVGAYEWTPFLDPKADVYGLAAQLYYAFTKTDPSLTEPYEPIQGIPERLENIIRKALEKDPDGTVYGSLREMLKDLKAVRDELKRSDEVAKREARAIREIETQIPAEMVAMLLNGGSVRLQDDQIAYLLGLQRPQASSWDYSGPAIRILRGFLKNYHAPDSDQSAADRVLGQAVREKIGMSPVIVSEILRAALRDKEDLIFGMLRFNVLAELNPRVFLIGDLDGNQWVVKIASLREYARTVDAGQQDYLRASTPYEPVTGTMIVQYYPDEFTKGLEMDGPEGLVRIVGRYAEAARRVERLNLMGLQHRDIFAHNLRLDASGEVHIVDFGLAEKSMPTTDRVDQMILGQALRSHVLGLSRWIPLAYRFKDITGGPETRPLNTLPPDLNAAIDKAIRRGYGSVAGFAEDLERVSRQLKVEHERELTRAFHGGATARILPALQNGHAEEAGARLAEARPSTGSPEDDAKLNEIFDQAARRLDERQLRQLTSAWKLAELIHRGQPRSLYEPDLAYITHPVRVAYHLIARYDLWNWADAQEAVDILCAAFLHDSVEDLLLGNLGVRLLRRTGKDPLILREVILGRIGRMVSPKVSDMVRKLTKTAAPAGADRSVRREAEDRYLTAIQGSDRGTQIVKVGDWHENFGSMDGMIAEGVKSRAATQRYLGDRLESALNVVESLDAPDRVRLTFLDHLLELGEANNRVNRTVAGAEDILTLSSEQREMILEARSRLTDRSGARMSARYTDPFQELVHGAPVPGTQGPEDWKLSLHARTKKINDAAPDGKRRVYIGQVTVTDDGFYQITDPRGLGGMADRVEGIFAAWGIPVTLEHYRVDHDTTPTRHFASIEFDYYLAVDPSVQKLVDAVQSAAERVSSVPGPADLDRAIVQMMDLVPVEVGTDRNTVETGRVAGLLGVRHIQNDPLLTELRSHFAPLGAARRIFLDESGEMDGYTQEGVHWEKMLFNRYVWVPRDLEPLVREYLALPAADRERLAGSTERIVWTIKPVFQFLSALHPSMDPGSFLEAFEAFAGRSRLWAMHANPWVWRSSLKPLIGYGAALGPADPIAIVRRVQLMDTVSDPNRGSEQMAFIVTAAAKPETLTPELMTEIDRTFSKHFVWAVNAAAALVQLRPELANENTVRFMLEAYGKIKFQDLDRLSGPARWVAMSENGEIRTAVGRCLERFLDAKPGLAASPAVARYVIGERWYEFKGALVYLEGDDSSLERAYKSGWHLSQMDDLVAALAAQGIPAVPVEKVIDPESYYHSESHYTLFRSLFFIRTEERYRDAVSDLVRDRVWAKDGDERARMVRAAISRVAVEQDAPGDLADRMRAAGIQEAPDATFAAIYREAVRVNPSVNMVDLHRLYRDHWSKIYQISADPGNPDAAEPGMSSVVIRHHETRLDDPSEDKVWLGDRSEGVTREETPLVDLVRTRLGLPDSFVTLRMSIENHDSTRHFYVGVMRELLYVPSQARDLALLLVTAGEDEFMHAVFGESADLEARLRRGTRVLGEGIRTSAMGGKESGFLTLKRAGLAYPPGIVLSPELAIEFARSEGEERRKMETFIARLLREAGVDFYVDRRRIEFWSQRGRDSDLVVARSNPRTSMPGILTSSEPTGSLHHGALKVTEAWDRPKARVYRDRMGQEHHYDQPLIIQKWVPGISFSYYKTPRKPGDRATLYLSGVMSTRNPDTGARELYGRFQEESTGDALMTNGAAGESLSVLADREPWLHQELLAAAEKLESVAGPQETEFVVEKGKLWFVQTRAIHFSPEAELAYLQEELADGRISVARTIPKIEALQSRLGARRIDRVVSVTSEPIARADASTAGAIEGRLVWDIPEARRLADQGESIVLVALKDRRDPVLESVFTFGHVGLIALDYGNNSSHEAALARHAGIPSLIHLTGAEFRTENGRRFIRLEGGRELDQGDQVILDGDEGVLYAEGTAAVEPSGKVADASHGIDIPTFRAAFTAPYLDNEGRVRPEFDAEALLRLNARHQEKYERLNAGPDAAAAFKANLEKHFIHDLLMQRRRERPDETASAGARLSTSGPQGLRRFAERAAAAIGLRHPERAVFAILTGPETLVYARSERRSAARLAAGRRAGSPDPSTRMIGPDPSGQDDLDRISGLLEGLPAVAADFELPEWTDLFPKNSRLSNDEMGTQIEFLTEQVLFMARTRPGLRFFMPGTLNGLDPAMQEIVRAAVRRSSGALMDGPAPRERGRLTVRVAAKPGSEEHVINLEVRPILEATAKPLWAMILAAPLFAAIAAVPDLADLDDPQAAFNAAQRFLDTEWAERAEHIFDVEAFDGGLTGTEFLDVLKGLKPFKEGQRPQYAFVSAAKMVQEVRAAIQRVRVMA